MWDWVVYLRALIYLIIWFRPLQGLEPGNFGSYNSLRDWIAHQACKEKHISAPGVLDDVNFWSGGFNNRKKVRIGKRKEMPKEVFRHQRSESWLRDKALILFGRERRLYCWWLEKQWRLLWLRVGTEKQHPGYYTPSKRTQWKAVYFFSLKLVNVNEVDLLERYTEVVLEKSGYVLKEFNTVLDECKRDETYIKDRRGTSKSCKECSER